MNNIGTEVDLLTIIISARAAGLVVSFLAPGPVLSLCGPACLV